MNPGKGQTIDAAEIVRTSQQSELERRVAALEKSFESSNTNSLDRHKTLITVIVSVFGLIVTIVVTGATIGLAILSSASRADTREATANMRSDVQRSIDEMKKRFDELAGETLKKPELKILLPSGMSLDGQVFSFTNGVAPPMFETLFLRNSGGKKTDPLSARLYCSSGVLARGGNWLQIPSLDKDLPQSYYLLGGSQVFGIAAGEDWVWDFQTTFLLNPPTTNGICKLQVFYGAEKPAEATFHVRTKW